METIKASDLDAALTSLASNGVRRQGSLSYKRRKLIKYISVVHYTKQNGKYYFACRVLPEADSQAFTILKTYEQFLDFSSHLAEAFPALYQKQLPRLNKKMAIFVTRSTLVQRRDDLDLWIRRLFDIPEVRSSRILYDFFQDESLIQKHPSNDITIRPTHSSRPSISISRRNTNERLPEEAMASRTPFQSLPPHMMRPALPHKRSTPNLRFHPTDLDYDLPPTPTSLNISHEEQEIPPSIESYPAALLGSHVARNRPSLESVARSVSTEHTITPSLLASTSTVTPEESPNPAAVPRTIPSTPSRLQRPKGPLRHFMSLQDIRQNAASHPAEPSPPPVQTSFTRMPRSRSSSNASDIHNNIAPSIPATPQVESKYPAEYIRQRRPSAKGLERRPANLPYRTHKHSGSHTSLHSHTLSASSIGSSETGDTSSSSSALLWSSEGDSFHSWETSPLSSTMHPCTPPTPQWSEPPFSPKNLIDNEQNALAIFNSSLVPLPDTLAFAGSPRSAVANRSRSSSLAKTPLEPIIGSPTLGTQTAFGSPGQPSTPLTASSTNTVFPPISPRDLITLKVRHTAANVVLRIERSATLAEAKLRISDKLCKNGLTILPSYDLFLVLKPNAELENEEDNFLLDAEESWKQAVATSAKLVLMC